MLFWFFLHCITVNIEFALCLGIYYAPYHVCRNYSTNCTGWNGSKIVKMSSVRTLFSDVGELSQFFCNDPKTVMVTYCRTYSCATAANTTFKPLQETFFFFISATIKESANEYVFYNKNVIAKQPELVFIFVTSCVSSFSPFAYHQPSADPLC